MYLVGAIEENVSIANENISRNGKRNIRTSKRVTTKKFRGNGAASKNYASSIWAANVKINLAASILS